MDAELECAFFPFCPTCTQMLKVAIGDNYIILLRAPTAWMLCSPKSLVECCDLYYYFIVLVSFLWKSCILGHLGSFSVILAFRGSKIRPFTLNIDILICNPYDSTLVIVISLLHHLLVMLIFWLDTCTLLTPKLPLWEYF